ncbi:SNARE-binding exocyst subunit S6 [Teratosphaeriaceae sp. CCFEE 6253]|nr:SNARE-binding exocyst subunit S6 [Teratosphaeriaceae sp. CCFEE 6253]
MVGKTSFGERPAALRATLAGFSESDQVQQHAASRAGSSSTLSGGRIPRAPFRRFALPIVTIPPSSVRPLPRLRHLPLNVEPTVRLPQCPQIGIAQRAIDLLHIDELLDGKDLAGDVGGDGVIDGTQAAVQAQRFEDAGGAGREADGGAQEGDAEEALGRHVDQLGLVELVGSSYRPPTMDALPLPSEDPTALLSILLKSPDDLLKLPSLRNDFTRKKALVDTHLKSGLASQLTTTQSGIANLSDAQKTVQLIKDEMMKIERLCAEAQGMIKDFPEINRMSVMQRNFAAVEATKASVDGFAERLEEMAALLREDEEMLDEQPNLLAIHEGITGLRDVRDLAMEQVRSSEAEGEGGLELIENLPLEGQGGVTLRELFGKLDEAVEWFDEHVGQACNNLINLVQKGNNGLVVRLGLVIQEEEKKDKQVKALQDAQREFQDVASRFKSINVGHRELRGYKDKFLLAISSAPLSQFEIVKQAFNEDPERLEKSCRWFFNDLNTVKLGLVELVPRKWKIFQTYTNIYHGLMHDFLVAQLDDTNITPVHMLAILNWVPKYHEKLRRLTIDPETLLPHVIDEREPELVREYRSLITTAVEQWMARMAAADRKSFSSREEGSLDQDAEGHLHTRSLGDMWTMLREQLSVAQSSGRPDVVEGVVDAMVRALRSRQKMWESLVDTEFARIESEAAGASNPSEVEGLSSFQDWLVAVANDQITNIDDDPIAGTTSFLTRFKAEFTPLVSPSYPLTTAAELESLTNGYIDLASHCMQLFARLLFTTDFRAVARTIFTPTWYDSTQQPAMRLITTTFEDYLSGENNITQVLSPSLRDILVEELSDTLLITYLSAIRNKGVKFRRADPFTDRIRDDVLGVFAFFKQPYADAPQETFELVRDKWRAVNAFEGLLSADKGAGVVEAYKRMREGYWDVQIGWVETVLRARDDFDRGMLSSVKSAAAGMDVERGMETVLGKVK